jgi:Uma2 family endonuclease
MTTATAPLPGNPPTESFADVADRLGGIAPHRIIWLPRAATEDDVVSFCEKNRLVELVDGFLVEKAMGFRESLLASSLIMFLKNYTSPRKLGLVGAPDAILRLRPGLVRLPDVSYISWGRLLGSGAHTMRVSPVAPELAVEIISDGNTRTEIDEKRRELLRAGTLVVWVIDQRTRTAEVYDDPTRPNQVTLLRETDAFDGGAALPGFRLPLADLFGDVEPPTEPAS